MFETTTAVEHEDEYGERERELELAIGKARLLRDAQAPGSADAAVFQARINTLTRTLLVLQEHIPQLRTVDKNIASARGALVDAQYDLAQASVPRLAGAGLVAIAGLVSLVIALESWGLPGVTAGLVLLTVGGMTVWLLARRRRTALDDLQDATSELARLKRQKTTLMTFDTRPAQTRRQLVAGSNGTTGVFATVARQADST